MGDGHHDLAVFMMWLPLSFGGNGGKGGGGGPRVFVVVVVVVVVFVVAVVKLVVIDGDEFLAWETTEWVAIAAAIVVGHVAISLRMDGWMDGWLGKEGEDRRTDGWTRRSGRINYKQGKKTKGKEKEGKRRAVRKAPATHPPSKTTP